MATISAVKGDTFDSIARRVTGDHTNASKIRAANPQMSEPLQSGASVYVPASDAEVAGKTDDSGIVVTIDGVNYGWFTELVLNRRISAPDSARISAPSGERIDNFSYQNISISVDGTNVFNGIVMGVINSGDGSESVSILAYEATGALQDCHLSPALDGHEWNGAKLSEIIDSVGAPFGVTASLDTDPYYGRVAAPTGVTAFNFLNTIARQRGVNLSFSGSKVTTVKEGHISTAFLEIGEYPVTSYLTDFKPQRMYSHVTAYAEPSANSDGGHATARNPACKAYRPLSFMAPDADLKDLQGIADNELGLICASAVKVRLGVSSDINGNGEMWQSGDKVSFNGCHYVMEAAEITIGQGRSADLALVPLGCYSGNLPTEMYWS